jgi:hypothetical protein
VGVQELADFHVGRHKQGRQRGVEHFFLFAEMAREMSLNLGKGSGECRQTFALRVAKLTLEVFQQPFHLAMLATQDVCGQLHRSTPVYI